MITMVKLNKHAHKYFRKVRSLLTCRCSQKRRIMNELKASVMTFLTDTPDADYEVIVLRFGKPEQIAGSLVEDMSTNEILRNLRTRKKIISFVLCAVLAGVAIWLGVAGAAYVKYIDQHDGYFEIVIDEEKNISNTEGE